MWYRLRQLGIGGNFYKAINAIYSNTMCCVSVNKGLNSEWFETKCGLKQGCLLSPLLFNLYVNSLAIAIKDTGLGVDIGEGCMPILLYADDIVLIAESETDLQSLLDVLDEWCKTWHLDINQEKSQVVHFRPKCVPKTEYIFNCGDKTLSLVLQYKYLGLILTEHLDYNVTTRMVAQSANRALGVLIAKSKALGGLPFDVFTRLYDAMVCPVIEYGAAIWGTKQYSWINDVQHRAMRFYMGIIQYTPIAALHGDMG